MAFDAAMISYAAVMSLPLPLQATPRLLEREG
jgi:hypothetical protein